MASNLIPNHHPSYKRLADILDWARWAGLLDRDAMDDAQWVLTE